MTRKQIIKKRNFRGQTKFFKNVKCLNKKKRVYVMIEILKERENFEDLSGIIKIMHFRRQNEF